MSAQLSRCVAVYSRHFVASRINAPAPTTQPSFRYTPGIKGNLPCVTLPFGPFRNNPDNNGWTKSLLDRRYQRAAVASQFFRTVPWLPKLTFSNFITDEHTVCSYK